jgi:hypothetical protein
MDPNAVSPKIYPDRAIMAGPIAPTLAAMGATFQMATVNHRANDTYPDTVYQPNNWRGLFSPRILESASCCNWHAAICGDYGLEEGGRLLGF